MSLNVYKHRKTNGFYRRIETATIQTDKPLADYDLVNVYRSMSDGSVWARPISEFHSRFEAVDDRGDWIQTYSGRAFYPFDPQPNEIDINDIAHALSMQCRFGGHIKKFYSTAEHSVNVCDLLKDRRQKLRALLHDGSEAFIADMVTPVKRYMPEYKNLEKTIQTAIDKKYGVLDVPYEGIKNADIIMLSTEADQLMLVAPVGWAPMPEPVNIQLKCLSPSEAKSLFLEKFHELFTSDVYSDILKP